LAAATRLQADRTPLAGTWYALPPGEVTAKLNVDPDVGLASQRAAELLREHGPNTLPVEKPTPGWQRFLGQYRSYMQLILVGAAVVSLAVKQWSTGVLLVLITVLNAVVGLRQEGRAEHPRCP
jgi:P-type Ca2+ transporter type 2C